MQREADRFVQVITAGEEPFQIVWASEAWLRLCEYESPQVLGQTLELIQGPRTDHSAIASLMDAIRTAQPITLSMINHTRTGRPFSHTIQVEPLRDSRGNVQCFQATSSNIDTDLDGRGGGGNGGGAAGGAAGGRRRRQGFEADTSRRRRRRTASAPFSRGASRRRAPNARRARCRCRAARRAAAAAAVR